MKKIGEFKSSPRISVRVYQQPGEFGALGGKYIARVYRGAVYHPDETRYAGTREGALRVAKELARSLRGSRENPSKRTDYKAMIPKAQIDFIVGNMHVGTPDEEVAENIRKRAEKMKWPQPAINAAVKYAVERHQKNRGLYGSVMSGRFNPSDTREITLSRSLTNRLSQWHSGMDAVYALSSTAYSGRPVSLDMIDSALTLLARDRTALEQRVDEVGGGGRYSRQALKHLKTTIKQLEAVYNRHK